MVISFSPAMLDSDMWIGLVNPDLNICTSESSNDCDDKFRWVTELADDLSAAHLEGNVVADGDGTCFAMTNENTVRDESCRKEAKFACEFSCEYGE